MSMLTPSWKIKPNWRLIEELEEFNEAIEELRAHPFVSVDTEFLASDSFLPDLCLIQITGSGDIVYCIDPKVECGKQFMEILNREIFHNENIMKVFHCYTQDLEVLHSFSGFPDKFIAPIFDTQLAVKFLSNEKKSISYRDLVRKYQSVELNKTDCRSNWEERPLSASQLEYAANDVYYLSKVYPLICKDLENLGRLQWVQEECKRGNKCGTVYKPNIQEAYTKLDSSGSGTLHQKKLLRALASWREEQAISHNKPRPWILSNQLLRELARTERSEWNYKILDGRLGNHCVFDDPKEVLDSIEKYIAPINIDDIPFEVREITDYESSTPFRTTVAASARAAIEEFAKKENMHPELLYGPSFVDYIAGRPSKFSEGFRCELLKPILEEYRAMFAEQQHIFLNNRTIQQEKEEKEKEEAALKGASQALEDGELDLTDLRFSGSKHPNSDNSGPEPIKKRKVEYRCE